MLRELIKRREAGANQGVSSQVAAFYALLGEKEKALQLLERVAEGKGDFWLFNIKYEAGNHAGAVEERAKTLELEGRPEDATLIRESFAKEGWEGFLREGLRQGKESYFRLALLKDANDADKEAFIKRLTEDHADRGGFWLFLVKTDPLYDPLRGDPRFQELLKKFNPPQ